MLIGKLARSFCRDKKLTKNESSENSLVVLTGLDESGCDPLRALLGNVSIVHDLRSLQQAEGRILLSFGTSVIVPVSILNRFKGNCYNIHAASPEYPGRDPHHWAVYDKVVRYGATLHVMDRQVDTGRILDVEWFDVPARITPRALLDEANKAAFRIIERIAPKIREGNSLLPIVDAQWSGIKRTRADFLKICRLSPDVSKEEFDRLHQAFDGGKYNNLTLDLYGHTFRIEK